MLDVSIWIDDVLRLQEQADVEREVETLARTIYPRPWGNGESLGPNGRRNSSREWAREGIRALRSLKPRA